MSRGFKLRQVRSVGPLLRILREERGLRQGDLAKRIGVQQSDLSRQERGEFRLTFDLLMEYLQALNVELEEFARRLDELETKKGEEKMPENQRHGLYVRDIPVDEIKEVARKLGIDPSAVIGILIRPFAGRIAETVTKNLVAQLGTPVDSPE